MCACVGVLPGRPTSRFPPSFLPTAIFSQFGSMVDEVPPHLHSQLALSVQVAHIVSVAIVQYHVAWGVATPSARLALDLMGVDTTRFHVEVSDKRESDGRCTFFERGDGNQMNRA